MGKQDLHRTSAVIVNYDVKFLLSNITLYLIIATNFTQFETKFLYVQ